MSKYIDKIVYINLDKRTDRRIEIENELNSYELTNYERFSAFETNGFGTLGCSNSHLQVLKNAKREGYRNILILEDDFTFIVSKDEFELELSKLFEDDTKVDFDVCMISYRLKNGFEVDEYPYLIKANDVQTASGYIVNSHFFDVLINLYEETNKHLEETREHWLYANDQAWKILQPISNWYCFSKRIGKQRLSFSDNANECTDYGF